MKNIVVISTSLRNNSNSETLAEAFSCGATDGGNIIDFISLEFKHNIAFCKGCMACQKSGRCVIEDDASEIMEKVCNADVVVFATPVYYYEVSGQMKTLIDRMNALYNREYKFREVYLLATCAEEDESIARRVENAIQGWVDCFEKAKLKGVILAEGVTEPEDIKGHKKLEIAYKTGFNC